MDDIFDVITREYEKEVVAPPVAVSRDQVPFTYEAISKEWLTDSLCHHISGAKVVEFALGDADDWTSNRRRIFLRYNRAGHDAGLPTSIFCKAAMSLTHRYHLGISGGAYSEYVFFSQARPLLSIDTPISYSAAWNPRNYTYIVLLEDIANEVEFCNFDTAISREAALSQMDILAELHAKFQTNPAFTLQSSGLPTWQEFWAQVRRNGFEEFSNQGFLDAEAQIPPRLYARYAEIWPAIEKSVALHDGQPATLMHGDTHLRQWYLRPNGRMGVTDWQGCSFGIGMRDVAYAMSTALAVDDRRNWERELIEHYLQQMRAHGAKAPSFDEAWLQYRQQLLSALSYWTITLRHPDTMPVMQPENATREFIRRMAHAIDDHNALNLF